MFRIIIFLCLFACTGCFNSKDSPVQGGCGVSDFPEPENKQPKIFKAQCASCHSLHKDATGPKLDGILDRVPSKEWLRGFITNQDSLVQIEDAYTFEIMKWSPAKWNHSLMDVAKKDVDTLMNYITQ